MHVVFLTGAPAEAAAAHQVGGKTGYRMTAPNGVRPEGPPQPNAEEAGASDDVSDNDSEGWETASDDHDDDRTSPYTAAAAPATASSTPSAARSVSQAKCCHI